MKLGKGYRLVRSGIALIFLLTIYAGVLFHAIGGKMNDVVCAANFGLMPVRTEHWEFGDLDGVHIYFPHKVWKQVPYHWLGDWIETEKYISSPGDFLIEGGKWMEEGGAGIVAVILMLDLVILIGEKIYEKRNRQKWQKAFGDNYYWEGF